MCKIDLDETWFEGKDIEFGKVKNVKLQLLRV